MGGVNATQGIALNCRYIDQSGADQGFLRVEGIALFQGTYSRERHPSPHSQLDVINVQATSEWRPEHATRRALLGEPSEKMVHLAQFGQSSPVAQHCEDPRVHPR